MLLSLKWALTSIKEIPVNHFLTIVSSLVLLVACRGPMSTSAPVERTPTATITDTPASTPITDIYAQNVHLFGYDSESPVRITEESVQQEDGYTVHDINYPSPKNGDVPAYLVVPEGPGPFAGILLMHGSSGSRRTLLPLAKDLVHTGAVVLTVSAPSARIPGRDWITFTPLDRDEQIQLMVDLRRGVDLLAQHEKVDQSRIGYMGYSYGAAMGGLLAGIEPRIKAYGLMVGDGGLVNHFTDEGEPVGGFERIDPTARESWLEAMVPIEPIHYVGHASPSALFFQNGRYDMSVSEEDALAYQAAGSEPKLVEWYESGHGLPPQAYVDMVAWLAEQIGIDKANFTLTS
jgi:dipeptidyl aminopeptidase/acylaminoacyl peptidase